MFQLAPLTVRRPQRARSIALSFSALAAMVIVLPLIASCAENTSESSDQTTDTDAAVLDDGAGVEGGLVRGRPNSPDDSAESTLAPTDAGNADDAKGPPGLVNVKQACEMRADRQCTRLQECSDFFLRMVFGKSDNCRARVSAECMAEAAAADVSITAFTLVRCAQETKDQTCADLMDRRDPEACQPLGLRREGKGCASDLQCLTGFCSLESKSCGTCKPKRGLAESCVEDSGCTSGLHCGLKGKCVRKGLAGDPCGAENQECGTLLSCLQGKCAAPLSAGAACLNTGQCQRAAGQVCSSNMGIRAFAGPIAMCRASVLAAVGEICRDADNIVAFCSSGAANCVANQQGVYRCVEAARDAEACGDKAGGRSCMLPAACVAGICRLGPSVSCMP